jgi:hypothetical protein
MQQRNVARELGLVVATIAVLVHWLDASPALLATALIAVAAAAGTGPLVGEWRPWRMPLIPMILPALAAFAIAGIAHIVAPVPWLPIVFVVGWVVVAGVVGLETAPDVLAAADAVAAAPAAPAISYATAPADTAPPTVRIRPKRRAEFDIPQIVEEPVVVNTPELPPHPRPLAVRSTALGLAFLAFVAVGGLVPGGLALDREGLSTAYLAEFVALNAVVAGLVGYRLASLASPHRFDRIVRVVAIGQYALPVAVAAAALRSLALPLLFVPALLALVVYVVSSLRESREPATQNRRLLQDLAILGIAALAVVAWGLLTK